NTGTLNNALWSTTAKNGKSLYFNGANSMVTIADSASLDLTKGMTLEAWVRPTSTTSLQSVILKERPGGLTYGLYSSNPGAATVYNGTSNYSAALSSALPVNQWSYLAATYDGANLRIYVNGVLTTTTAMAGSMATSGGKLRLGG